jgi:predicted metal-dependent peptidase
MIIKNIHEKLLDCVEAMVINTRVKLPYYGQFNLHINFHESKTIKTCGVNITRDGMNFWYSSPFLDNKTQEEVNFITLHEDFHLLFDHPKRTTSGRYDHKLANIAQDMIINHIIVEDMPKFFIEIPKDEEGKNMALFVPVEYEGNLIFEELYEWLKEQKDKRDSDKKNKSKNKMVGGSDSDNDDCESDSGDSNSTKPSYGPYGKNPNPEKKDGKSKDNIDTWSLDHILDNLDNSDGEYLDNHLIDEIPEEMREAIVKDIMNKLTARGFETSDTITTINKLRKKKKDYLREIKRSISNVIFGSIKEKTIVKPNRKRIEGLKGNRRIKTKINCILDTSGSMGGTFEKVLSYIYRNDIEVNLIEADTEVKLVESVKNKKELSKLEIKGLGGTELMPAINYIVSNFNEYNTVILTDGYCDSLDVSKIKGRILIITIGVEVPILKTNGRIKQIIVDESYQ